MSEELTVLLRKEAARNARMQGDKEHQTNQRRKTFRFRNHILTAAADRIEKLEATLSDFRESNRILRLDRDLLNAVKVLRDRIDETNTRKETDRDYALAQVVDELDKILEKKG